MAQTETGWTKEYPSLAYGSWFWLRNAPNATPELHQLTGGRNWMESFGIVRDTTEFLGPVTVSDAEQLIELRKLAKGLLEAVDHADYGVDVYSLAPNLKPAANKVTRTSLSLTEGDAMKLTRAAYMCRIPPVDGEKYHVVGKVNEPGTTDEPSRAFWTNASVKALMAQEGPQPEYVSICGTVRGDWRSIQVLETPFAGDVCNRCEQLEKLRFEVKTNAD